MSKVKPTTSRKSEDSKSFRSFWERYSKAVNDYWNFVEKANRDYWQHIDNVVNNQRDIEADEGTIISQPAHVDADKPEVG